TTHLLANHGRAKPCLRHRRCSESIRVRMPRPTALPIRDRALQPRAPRTTRPHRDRPLEERDPVVPPSAFRRPEGSEASRALIGNRRGGGGGGGRGGVGGGWA